MRYVLKASAMLMLCVRISSADTELVELSRMTIHGPAGSNIVSWTLPSDAFEKQPRWDPLNQEIPLLPHAAIKAAAAWLQKEGEATNDLRVASLDLRLSHKDKWLYWIRFTPTVSLAKSRFVPSTVLVTLDGTVIEPGPVNTNAIPATTVSARRPFVSETRTSTNATSAIPIGMKGSYETVEAKIIKAFVVDDEGARFRAYEVMWKDHEVIVEDPLGKTDKKEGDTLIFMASRSEMPRGEDKRKTLRFIIMEFGGRKFVAPEADKP